MGVGHGGFGRPGCGDKNVSVWRKESGDKKPRFGKAACRMKRETHHPLHGLPPLAGLATLEEAARPGLGVEESVSRLKRHHYVLRRLHGVFLGRLAAEPVYELKMAFSLHAHWCAEHVAALRQRVGEMREPPLGLDVVPHPGLSWIFDELQAAPSATDLLLGVYGEIVPALCAAMQKHRAESNPLADQPSVRLLRFALLELEDMAEYGRKALEAMAGPEERQKAGPWIAALRNALRAAGGLDGAAPCEGEVPEPVHGATPWKYDPVPRRDDRFPDPYNMGVNAEAFLNDPAQPAAPKVLMMFFKRLREIDVPEVMSSILMETPGKPWAYYRDMTRQLWDEARHAMMGEVGFWSVGVDWRRAMVNFTWSLGLNTQLTAKERHGVLYFIEQGLMPKTGKRFEWETAQSAGNPLSRVFQDYDWADEVLHARIGRDWYVSQFENPKEAVEWGDRCWSKVVTGWAEWKEQGLTSHRNWWPDVYSEYCASAGLEPDPGVAAYDVSYERQRADLKVLAASA